MKDQLLLSEFANEDGFELNGYLTQLFEYFSIKSQDDDLTIEPTL
ncbi:hypothetical protein V7128_15805 [Neobacillus vireti]